MSDKAIAGITTQILLDKIKSSMNGSYSYSPASALSTSSGEGWIYAEKSVTSGSDDLLATATEDYLGSAVGAGTIAAGDKIKWIAIKHTGTSDGTTVTAEGVVLALAAGTAAHDLGPGIFLDVGDLIVLKLPNTTVADLHAITVRAGAGVPSGAGSGTVRVRIAAILENVG